jgi:hypothetical protein
VNFVASEQFDHVTVQQSSFEKLTESVKACTGLLCIFTPLSSGRKKLGTEE